MINEFLSVVRSKQGGNIVHDLAGHNFHLSSPPQAWWNISCFLPTIQAARRSRWTDRVQSETVEGWRVYFTPSLVRARPTLKISAKQYSL